MAASFAYNSRLQLASLTYTQNTTKLLDLAYAYTSATQAGNNGQIQSITDNTGTQEAGRSVNYSYDAWLRVKTAQTTGSTSYPQWGLSWDYDRFGNRKNQNVTLGTGYSVLLSISESTNRVSSPYAYDASGNMTNDTLHSYTFDAENRITQVDGGTAGTNAYDGSGLRVKKTVGANTTRYIFSGTKPIAEYVNGSLNTEYIYAGSQLLATLNSSGVPTYHHSDHLSTRVSTDSTGAVVRTFGNYPFGETWCETGAANKWKFTSYERDSESSLDYAMFRFDSSRLGRFQTPDPLGGTIRNPQSLNRYAYTLNDPINFIDPLGLDGKADSGVGTGSSFLKVCFGSLCLYVMTPYVQTTSSAGPDLSTLHWLSGGGGGGGLRERFLGTDAEDKGDGGTASGQQRCAGSISIGPVTVSLSTTILVANLGTTGSIGGVVGVTPPWVNVGAGIDIAIWGPRPGTPYVSPYVGWGRHLSVGSNLTPQGYQGVISIGINTPGPPIGVQVPVVQACNPQ